MKKNLMRKKVVHEIRCLKAKQIIKFFISIIFTMLLKIYTLFNLIKMSKTNKQTNKHASKQIYKQTNKQFRKKNINIFQHVFQHVFFLL